MSDDLFRTEASVRVRRENDDEFIVYHDERGYATNDVGADVIERCRGVPQTAEAVAKSLSSEYDADENEILRDVTVLMEEFVANGIMARGPVGGVR